MRRYLCIAAVAFALFADHANAQTTSPMSGNELYLMCTSSANAASQAVCLTYLDGFVEGLTFGQEVDGLGAAPICLQTGVTTTQMQLMTEKAAREHRELLNQGAAAIVAKALYDAFKCKPGEKPVYGR